MFSRGCMGMHSHTSQAEPRPQCPLLRIVLYVNGESTVLPRIITLTHLRISISKKVLEDVWKELYMPSMDIISGQSNDSYFGPCI